MSHNVVIAIIAFQSLLEMWMQFHGDPIVSHWAFTIVCDVTKYANSQQLSYCKRPIVINILDDTR